MCAVLCACSLGDGSNYGFVADAALDPLCSGEGDASWTPSATHEFLIRGTKILASIQPGVDVAEVQAMVNAFGEVNAMVEGTLATPAVVKIVVCPAGIDFHAVTQADPPALVLYVRAAYDGVQASARDSLAASVHEYGHILYELAATERSATLRTLFAAGKVAVEYNRLETLNSRDPRLPQLRAEYDRIAAGIPQRYSEVSYTELFADALAAFWADDAKAAWRPAAELPLPEEYAQTVRVRDFTATYTTEELSLIQANKYTASAGVRNQVWLAGNPPSGRAALLLTLVELSIADLDGRTDPDVQVSYGPIPFQRGFGPRLVAALK